MTPDAAPASRLVRILRAPLSALLRARRRHRWETIIDHAEIPPPLRDLTRRVVARTGLWPSERQDVARELCAHFADGLALGRSADDLIRDFGDPLAAARLIRRAKKRCRPLAWILWVRAWQALAGLLVLLVGAYLVLLVRFVTGEPTIARNFAREINRDALATRPEDRAWPIYARVATHIHDTLLDHRIIDEQEVDILALRPGDLHWDVLVRVLRLHATDLADLRRASQLPAQGLVLTDAMPPELHEWARRAAARANVPEPVFAPPSDNPFLVGVLIPSLGHARTFARLLAADARLALSEGDGSRAVDDWIATFDISRHQLEHPLLISALASADMDTLVFDQVGQALADHPEALTDEHLTRLAHRLAAIPNMPLARALEGERAYFLDFLQRAYTDDGRGDGRLTPAGVALMNRLGETVAHRSRSSTAEYLVGPALLAVDVGRKRIRQEYERVLDALLRHAATPIWQRTTFTITAELERIAGDPLRSASLASIAILTPALEKAVLQADFHATRRDALQAVIALELFRRRHHRYPATLDELVPDLLPRVPVDPFTGEPLRYRSHGAPWSAGRPVLYSVSTNRVDDDGTPAENNPPPRWIPLDVLEQRRVAGDPSLDEPHVRTDWILWPPTPNGRCCSPVPPSSVHTHPY